MGSRLVLQTYLRGDEGTEGLERLVIGVFMMWTRRDGVVRPDGITFLGFSLTLVRWWSLSVGLIGNPLCERLVWRNALREGR